LDGTITTQFIMHKTAVLVIEDEEKVAASIKQWLEETGFKVDIAPDGAVGRHLAVNQLYDVVLLDLNLPFVHGLEVCKWIRTQRPNLPIILVTALESIEDKLAGFEAGADDYLVKPFDFRELSMRIKAVRSRTPQSNAGDLLQVADLKIDLAQKTVERTGKPIELTAKEFSLLVFLAQQKGRIVSRHEIAEHVWDLNFDSGTNVVEVYINFLRKKIDKHFEPKLIHTKPGMGYFLKRMD
jgi:two-component system copper resistance phosphate regulon response regulator CusR